MRLSVLKMLEKNGVSTDNVDLIAKAYTRPLMHP